MFRPRDYGNQNPGQQKRQAGYDAGGSPDELWSQASDLHSDHPSLFPVQMACPNAVVDLHHRNPLGHHLGKAYAGNHLQRGNSSLYDGASPLSFSLPQRDSYPHVGQGETLPPKGRYTDLGVIHPALGSVHLPHALQGENRGIRC